MARRIALLFLIATAFSYGNFLFSATIKGELKKWHKVTFLFDGVSTSESATPNPFRDYRLIVTFTKGVRTITVYGHYAADGDAGETSASGGDKWRVYFTPDETGTWNYSVSFRTGTDINLDDTPSSGTAVPPLDGETNSFTIAASNKTGNDFRAKGRLGYANAHYLRFAETGDYFIKGGTDSPENFLAYYQFDGTYDSGGPQDDSLINGLHRYSPHTGHWNAGDPTWQSGEGKGIIGALNYLAAKGMNTVYFLTYNVDGGDGRDTWMWTSDTERWRYDVSKLDQWEIVFSHMDSLGIQMHLVTQETENDNLLGGSSNLNNIRRLYYKELASRFAHHLAVLWNIGEENSNTDAQRAAFAQYIREHDPYDNPITVHTLNNPSTLWETFYGGILNDTSYLKYFEVTSLQGNASLYNSGAASLRTLSETKGKKWIICGDEQTPDVDFALSNINTMRKDGLWGNMMGGGGGVEWYFGYDLPNEFGDIASEDFIPLSQLWDQTKIALDFFHTYLPFDEMTPDNSLFSANNGATGYCLAKVGETYAVYIKPGVNNVTVSLNISGTDNYTVKWFNTRTGGALQNGTVTSLTAANGVISIGKNPANDNNDWVALVTKNAIVVPTSTTWTGNVSDNWFNSSNWTSGIPDATLDVIIPNVSPKSFPLIQGPAGTIAEVEDLTIHSNAQVTVSNLNNVQLMIHGIFSPSGQVLGTGRLTFNGGITHTVPNPLSFSGVLEVKSGSTLVTNGNLTLQDGASLLHGTGTPNGGGTVSGTIKMRRNGNSNSTAYSYWSSPVAGANVSLLGNDLYYYNPNNATDNTTAGLRNGWVAAGGSMSAGLGYIGRGNSMVEFNSSPNDGNYSVAVSKNAATGVGWNLIGNPYPCAIDAAAFMAVNGPAGSGTISGALYFWDDDQSNGSGWATQDYAVWSGAGTVAGPNTGTLFQGHIASGQGFFALKTASGTANVQFSNSMRSSINNSFFRQSPIQRLWLSAVSPNGFYNETLIAFIDDATDGDDPVYDAKKLKGNDNVALYTKIQNEIYAIQALSLLNGDKSVVMGMDAGVSGTFTLNLKAIENLDETVCIYLEDTHTGIIQDLRLNPVYTFTTTAGIFDSRFILHFTAPLKIEIKGATCDGNDGEVTLMQAGSKEWNYILAASSGANIERKAGFNGINVITDLSSGSYTLTLRDAHGYEILKPIDISGVVPVSNDFTMSSSIVMVNEMVSFTNLSTGATSYEWYFGDSNTSADVNPVYAYRSPGSYKVILRAVNDDCQTLKGKIITVLKKDDATGITADEEKPVKIYGAQSSVYVQFGALNSGRAAIEVFNVLGERIYKNDSPTTSTVVINLPFADDGFYLVRVTMNGRIFRGKVALTAQ